MWIFERQRAARYSHSGSPLPRFPLQLGVAPKIGEGDTGGHRGPPLRSQTPHPSTLTRISPQLPYFLKSCHPVSCARRGKTIFPHDSEWNRQARRRSHGIRRRGEGEGGRATRAGARGHPSIRGFAATQDEAEGAFSRRGSTLMRPGMTREMIIMIFSIKFDKFTGFFDKFLKIISLVTGFNTRNYYINLSVRALRFKPQKSFPAPAHLPATARICGRADGWPTSVPGGGEGR